MQLNAATYRIVVATSVCPKFPHGARKVLKIVTAALQTLGHRTSHKVVLHTQSGDVDMHFLRYAKSKNQGHVRTSTRQLVPTAEISKTWLDPERPVVPEPSPSPTPVTGASAVPT